jgi:hypothetical protein
MWCPRCYKKYPGYKTIPEFCLKCGAKLPILQNSRIGKGPKNWDQLTGEEKEEFNQACEEGTEEGFLKALREWVKEQKMQD